MNSINEVEFYFGEDEWHQKKTEYQNKFVCYQCIYDSYVQDFIKKSAVKKQCDFCHSKCRALDLLSIILLIHEAIYELYADTSSEYVYCNSEDGWPCQVFDTNDLITEIIEDPITENLDLQKVIIDSLPEHMWCRKDIAYLAHNDALMYSWKRFCELVKYKARYVFFSIKDDMDIEDNLISCNEIPEALSNIVISSGLVTTLKKNVNLYRARKRDTSIFYNSAQDLGPPPENKASQSRMSPLGISMFYCSDNIETAKLEIRAEQCSVGEFRLLNDVKIIDFTNLPAIPSMFDQEQRSKFYLIKFLYDFVKDITKPINPNDKNFHIDYIPTQIMTEYFRYLFPEKILGIKYPSSYGHGNNYVFFITNEQTIDSRKKALPKSLFRLKSCVHFL